MIQFFGRKGEPGITPESHNQNTEFKTYSDGEVIAKGKWVSDGFHLLSGSLIRIEDMLSDNKGVWKIKEELIKLGWVVKSKDKPEFFILQRDIGLYSRSTAARLVHGNSRNSSSWK